MQMFEQLKQEKPWAKLRLSRKDYETKRPWLKSGLGRKAWESFVLALPDEAIEALYREADADKLVKALFGETGE